MSIFLNSLLKLRDSVDVYISDSLKSESNINMFFYHINTRRRVGIEINPIFCDILERLDGKTVLSEILDSVSVVVDVHDVDELFFYLIENGILEEVGKNKEKNDERFSRQINFFGDWIFDSRGGIVQDKISSSHCVIFGVGAVGGTIATLLVRAGVKNLTIFDYKSLHHSSVERHQYFSKDNLGMKKVKALKLYLKKINKDVNVNCFDMRIVPDTDLSQIVPKHSSIVINTADEPYIGHTSIKIGRYLWENNIPLYIPGGFDAHLMSTGDFIIPGESFCVDCCSNYFKVSLKDWKPIYKIHEKSIKFQHIVGGSGGTYGMSLFSASFATMQIINFLGGGNSYKNILNRRGEFSSSDGKFSWVNISGRRDCACCSKKVL